MIFNLRYNFNLFIILIVEEIVIFFFGSRYLVIYSMVYCNEFLNRLCFFLLKIEYVLV